MDNKQILCNFVYMVDEKTERRLTDNGFIHQNMKDGHIFKRMPMKKQQALKKKIRVAMPDYTFLHNQGLINRWVTRNFNIGRASLEMLLYMYPINLFYQAEFLRIQRTLGVKHSTVWTQLRQGGWIEPWSKVGRKIYYVLSPKANNLVSRLHRLYLGIEEIPLGERRSKIAASKDKKDQDLMELFKAFNKKVKDGKQG